MERVVELYDESTNLTEFIKADKLEAKFTELKNGTLEIVEEHYIPTGEING